MPIDADSPNLDVLRACAVLVVLAFHTVGFFNRGLASNLGLEQLGRLAVLFFFVHTCLVLMLSLERQTAKFGLHNLHWIFMTRRAFRVYPLSIAVVLAVFLLGLPVAGPPWAMHPQHLTARGLLANVLLLQNVTMSGSVVIPLWSLPYEIQMYLVLPPSSCLSGGFRHGGGSWPYGPSRRESPSASRACSSIVIGPTSNSLQSSNTFRVFSQASLPTGSPRPRGHVFRHSPGL